ncbi:hypothetical protein [Janthinobacterium sp. TND4EL3]|uniref:hypothetical protein n=1 Tax=Janthinobacterium sp. TND4EL3 TaxID=1907311 RepID=UPI0014836E8F|nr:hypothetical protein [Janthinobacterium sp. TND4EL3]
MIFFIVVFQQVEQGRARDEGCFFCILYQLARGLGPFEPAPGPRALSARTKKRSLARGSGFPLMRRGG